MLSGCGETLFDGCASERRRGGARGVQTRNGQRAALRRPVAVHLADHQLSGVGGPNPPFEAAVGGDLQLPVIERGLAGGHVVVGVLAAEQLETQVGGGAAPAGDDVIVVGVHPGAEVQRVGVVQAHLGERPGARLQEGMVAVVVEGQMGAGGDTPGQILESFEQVGFGLDVRCGRHEFFGLGDRGGERARKEFVNTPRR